MKCTQHYFMVGNPAASTCATLAIAVAGTVWRKAGRLREESSLQYREVDLLTRVSYFVVWWWVVTVKLDGGRSKGEV